MASTLWCRTQRPISNNEMNELCLAQPCWMRPRLTSRPWLFQVGSQRHRWKWEQPSKVPSVLTNGGWSSRFTFRSLSSWNGDPTHSRRGSIRCSTISSCLRRSVLLLARGPLPSLGESQFRNLPSSTWRRRFSSSQTAPFRPTIISFCTFLASSVILVLPTPGGLLCTNDSTAF